MTPYETARRAMHSTANLTSLHAVRRVIEERERELIEEIVSGGNAAELQAKFQELRHMRDALSMPVIRPGVVTS
jgi:hypothetical protein